MDFIKHKLFFILLSLFVLKASAQETDDYVNDNVIRYDDHVYKPSIKTVQIHSSEWEFSPPLLELNSNDQIELSFDDLDGDQKQYSISFIHCNADWTPSEIMNMEYMEGFNSINIINFSFSMNTLQKYTHYSVMFPNQTLKFTKSGNYIVCVHPMGNEKELVITRRFMVFENMVNIPATIRQTIGGDQQYNKQQIEFSVKYPGLNAINPAKDFKVTVTQNNRWDNAHQNIEPTFFGPNELTYNMNEAAVFNGGNEFRFFDMRSLRVYSERIKDMYKDANNVNHVVLTNEENRQVKQYVFANDINGGFLIKNRDIKSNQDTEADYAYVDFFMPYPTPESSGNFYIMGKLTDWRMNKTNLLKYNYKRMGYECQLYLKQGYYNYIIVLSEDGKNAADETKTEGNHWDTENDYTIFVYFRQVGTYYDRLVGIKKINSLKR